MLIATRLRSALLLAQQEVLGTSSAAPSSNRTCLLLSHHSPRLNCGIFHATDAVYRGCNSLAIVDLKEEEAQKAAEELKSEFGSLLREEFLDLSDLRYLKRALFSVNNGKFSKGELNVIGIGCDVSSEVSVQKAFKVATEEFGRVDSVVASAGAYQNKL